MASLTFQRPGFPGGLTAEQATAVATLRGSLPAGWQGMKFPPEDEEAFCCRLLRARKWDAAAAVETIVKGLLWRQEQGVDQLAALSCEEVCGCPSEILEALYPQAYLPYAAFTAKHGVLIPYIVRAGVIDAELMLAASSLPQLLRHHIWWTERMLKGQQVEKTAQAAAAAAVEASCAAAAGGAAPAEAPPQVTQLLTVIDLSGIGSHLTTSAARDFVQGLSEIDNNYYPEILGEMMIVNAPALFRGIWSIIAAFLDENTLSKIGMYAGPEEWQAKLLQLVGGADKLPAELGGSLAVQGSVFSPSAGTQAAAERLSIASGAVEVLQLQVPAEAGPSSHELLLHWVARPHDIEFGVSFAAAPNMSTGGAAGKPEAVYPMQAHPQPEGLQLVQWRHTAPGPGTYTLTWSNKKGWRARELVRRCLVQPVEGSAAAGGAAGVGAVTAAGAAGADVSFGK